MSKKNLWAIGLTLAIAAALVNGLLIRSGVGGVVRELARLGVIGGVVLFVVGLFKRKK